MKIYMIEIEKLTDHDRSFKVLKAFVNYSDAEYYLRYLHRCCCYKKYRTLGIDLSKSIVYVYYDHKDIMIRIKRIDLHE